MPPITAIKNKKNFSARNTRLLRNVREFNVVGARRRQIRRLLSGQPLVLILVLMLVLMLSRHSKVAAECWQPQEEFEN